MSANSTFYLALASLALALTPARAQPLPGVRELRRQGDLARQMVASIDSWLRQFTLTSPQRRPPPGEPQREAWRRMIGLVDPRLPFDAPVLDATLARPARVGRGSGFEILAVRWPVLDGVDGEGLLLRPAARAPCAVVALPDADWTPEMLAGLAPGLPPSAQFARRLAESGCLVAVPFLIDRRDTYSANPAINRFTNQPHREFIYRMAFPAGRHIIGYEVQKVLALVDWFHRLNPRPALGLIGYGEGGLLALAAAAADTRIDATVVSGYFGPREQLWREPIYRNVWSQLTILGDAELAGLVAPRFLLIEAARPPDVSGPPPPQPGRQGAAPGAIPAPALTDVERELARARRYHPQVAFHRGGPGADESLRPFLRALGRTLAPPAAITGGWNPGPRDARQFRQLVDHAQRLVRQGPQRRAQFHALLDPAQARRQFHDEVLGRMPPPSAPLEPESRLLYDQPRFRGYEILLPVWDDIFAYGVLLLPKDLRPGERRPVVVCQHGLEGRPQHLIDPPDAQTAQVYARFAAVLAERGFIVFAPQNPYIFGEEFRLLQRLANPLKLSLFSFIAGQHARILDWLSTLPFVDPARIGFYGFSYGGTTALRVPAVEPRYALSICSGNFNDWLPKLISPDYPFTYLFTAEWEIFEWNLAATFNHAEMASLIAPRPFMVERGHHDGVGIDEWVASEYAKVRRLYASLGLAQNTAIEFFDGGHRIHGVGAFEFLHRHLNWPQNR